MTRKKIDSSFYARRRLLNSELTTVWRNMVDLLEGRLDNNMVLAMNDFSVIPDTLGDRVRLRDERGLFEYYMFAMKEIEVALETGKSLEDVHSKVLIHYKEMGSRYRANEGKPWRTVRKL